MEIVTFNYFLSFCLQDTEEALRKELSYQGDDNNSASRVFQLSAIGKM